ALAITLCGITTPLAQNSPLDLDRAARANGRALAAANARARQAAERASQEDALAGPPRFFERLFAGLPPLPPMMQFDPYSPEPYNGRRDHQTGSEAYEPDQRPIDPKFLPQNVAYSSEEKPGTIIVDTASRYLYYVLADGRAQRYGIGVGRAGF